MAPQHTIVRRRDQHQSERHGGLLAAAQAANNNPTEGHYDEHQAKRCTGLT